MRGQPLVPNQEHLALLYKGVKFWNQWRMQHWNERLRPNLSGVSLRGVDLSGANFGLVDFTDADLSDSTLLGAYFLGANLSYAKLTRAKCKGAYFSDAILRGTDFRDAWLFSADFSRADLTEACLENAHLGAVRAIDTKFNHAKLTGACIEDWQINKAKLDEVECQYVYLKYPNQERCPSEREFFQGEFTRRFQISQNILELAFSDGMPWKAFAYAFNEVNLQVLDEYGSELFLQEYKVLGEDLVILKIGYPPEADSQRIQEALGQKTHELELKIARLEGEVKAKDETLKMFEQLLSPLYPRVVAKPSRIHIDDINSFEKVRCVDFNSISKFLNFNGYLNISEDTVQLSLEKILNEKFHKKDWGGEYNDLYTSNLIFDGKRRATAFLLKGNGLKVNNMEIKHCGKNGDQLLRLFESPAELFIIQFVGNISEAVVKDIEGKVEQLRAKGKQAYYCVINGTDTARLLYSYDLL